MSQGKPVLNMRISSHCFQVKDANGKLLQGKEKLYEVVKDLLRKDLDVQPNDFVKLKSLINNRVMGYV